jgi:ankyrin repeat protein
MADSSFEIPTTVKSGDDDVISDLSEHSSFDGSKDKAQGSSNAGNSLNLLDSLEILDSSLDIPDNLDDAKLGDDLNRTSDTPFQEISNWSDTYDVLNTRMGDNTVGNDTSGELPPAVPVAKQSNLMTMSPEGPGASTDVMLHMNNYNTSVPIPSDMHHDHAGNGMIEQQQHNTSPIKNDFEGSQSSATSPQQQYPVNQGEKTMGYMDNNSTIPAVPSTYSPTYPPVYQGQNQSQQMGPGIGYQQELRPPKAFQQPSYHHQEGITSPVTSPPQNRQQEQQQQHQDYYPQSTEDWYRKEQEKQQMDFSQQSSPPPMTHSGYYNNATSSYDNTTEQYDGNSNEQQYNGWDNAATDQAYSSQEYPAQEQAYKQGEKNPYDYPQTDNYYTEYDQSYPASGQEYTAEQNQQYYYHQQGEHQAYDGTEGAYDQTAYTQEYSEADYKDPNTAMYDQQAYDQSQYDEAQENEQYYYQQEAVDPRQEYDAAVYNHDSSEGQNIPYPAQIRTDIPANTSQQTNKEPSSAMSTPFANAQFYRVNAPVGDASVAERQENSTSPILGQTLVEGHPQTMDTKTNIESKQVNDYYMKYKLAGQQKTLAAGGRTLFGRKTPTNAQAQEYSQQKKNSQRVEEKEEDKIVSYGPDIKPGPKMPFNINLNANSSKRMPTVNGKSFDPKSLQIWNRFFENAVKRDDANNIEVFKLAEFKAMEWPKNPSLKEYHRIIGATSAQPDHYLRDVNLKTCLIMATMLRDTETVELLLNLGTDPNAADLKKRSACHYASKLNDTGILALLTDYGADLEMKDAKGRTPLHTAVVNACEEASKYLLESAVDVDALDEDGNAALHLVAHAGDLTVNVLELLLEYSAKQDIKNSLNMYPVMYAKAVNEKSNDLPQTIKILQEVAMESGNKNLIAAASNAAVSLGDNQVQRTGAAAMVDRLLEMILQLFVDILQAMIDMIRGDKAGPKPA